MQFDDKLLIVDIIFMKYFSASLSQNTINWFFGIYTTVIILLCVLPINSSGSGLNDIFLVSIRLDYLAHFILFIPWVFLLWKKVGVSFKSDFRATIFYILLGLLFATANEAIQYLLPYRAFNINDLLANCIGIGIGAIFFIK